ncbi:MAG: TetR/AcrR family transcriptional regulator [Acidimicrobiales bacterium]
MSEASTRDVILREARACFARQGFEGTSLNDIAAGVGIRRPSLLHYFPSKEAIYREVLTEALLDWGRRLDRPLPDDATSGWERVDDVLKVSFDFFVTNPEIVVIVRREALTEESHLGFDLGAALRPYYERAVDFFRREMDRGVFREHDAEHLVLTGYGALLTYFSDHALLRGLIDVDPYGPDELQRRFAHMRAFIRSALEPPAKVD